MARAFVIGDIILDEFVYGDVRRISPEAATPVLAANRTERMLGGAGNVARGIQALGTKCSLLGVVGDDRTGHDMIEMFALDRKAIDDPIIITENGRVTTHKTRYVSEQHSSHLLRMDRESRVGLTHDTEQAAVARIGRAVFDADVVVISDYCKGFVTDAIARRVIREAKSKPVIVDSKRADLSIFKGATIIKINAEELGRAYNATQQWITTQFTHTDADTAALCEAGRQLTVLYGIDHLIVTRGELGMLLLPNPNVSREPVIIPGKVVRVRDVSGAGDTVVATLASRLAQGQDLLPALHGANHAAAIAVSKPGTAVVTAAEMNGGDIAPVGNWELLDQRLTEWRGKRIGFTNGCFDLLHPGHLHLLMQARSQCDKLIVGLNSDLSVRKLKGKGRPVQNEHVRAEMLAALDNVDLVVVFKDDTPTDLVKMIRPDVIFKGDDYSAAEVAGHEYATNVQIISRVAGHSTTATIGRIKP